MQRIVLQMLHPLRLPRRRLSALSTALISLVAFAALLSLHPLPAAAQSPPPPDPAPTDKSIPPFPTLDNTLADLVAQHQAALTTAGDPTDHAKPDPAGSSPIPFDAAASPPPPSQRHPLTIHTDNPGAVLAFLRTHGIPHRNAGLDYVETSLPVALIASAAQLPGVSRVASYVPPHSGQSVLVGDVDEIALRLHQAHPWRDAGYDGAGVKVGVIDFGFDGLGFDILFGQLPPLDRIHFRCYRPITASPRVAHISSQPDSCQQGVDHGTKVARSLFDIAPGIELYIANPSTKGDLQSAVDWMIEQGVQVISHSISWGYDGPGDGSSPFSASPLNAVQRATAAGIVWLNSAGNYAQQSWFGGYDSVTVASGTPGRSYTWLRFGAATESFGGIPVLRVALDADTDYLMQMRWQGSWPGPVADLDLFLWRADNGAPWRPYEPVLLRECQSASRNNIPFEAKVFRPPRTGDYYIGVQHFSRSGHQCGRTSSTPDWIQILAWGMTVKGVSGAGSIGNPAESADPAMLAVGAVRAVGTPPVPGLFSVENRIEYFSSRGPAPEPYSPVEDRRIKPDIVGIDGLPPGYLGTSFASPYLAGLVALVRQRFPEFSPVQTTQYLKDHARDRGAPGPDNKWGHGFARLPQLDMLQYAVARERDGEHQLVLVYDHLLDPESAPAATDFTLTTGSDAETAPTAVAIDGARVVLTLAVALPADQPTTVAYTLGATRLRTQDGVAIPAAAHHPVIPAADNAAPQFQNPAAVASEYRYIEGEPIAVVLPTATGGNRLPVYHVASAPDGLSLSTGPDANLLHGFAADPDTHDLTYTATDPDGDRVAIPFRIVVEADTQPAFADSLVVRLMHCEAGDVINEALPTVADGNSGNGDIVYALTQIDSAPLSDDHVWRAAADGLACPPTPGLYTLAWTVTDANADSAQITYFIDVTDASAPSFGARTIASVLYPVDTDISLPLPEAVNHSSDLTYTLTEQHEDTLPHGFAFDPSTRILSGRSDARARHVFEYRAHADEQMSDPIIFALRIDDRDIPAPAFTNPIAARTYTQHAPGPPIALPTAVNGQGALAHTLTLADGAPLPDTLSFQPDHCALVVAPSAEPDAYSLLYTATDQSGVSAERRFIVTVGADRRPSFGDAHIADAAYRADDPPAVLPLPTVAAHGDGAIAYALEPADGSALPPDLSFDADAPALQIEPATPGEWLLAYRALDADGDADRRDFKLSILPDTQPTFAHPMRGDASFLDVDCVERQVCNVQLPSARSGDGELTYALLLPGGDPLPQDSFAHDPLTRTLTFVPEAPLQKRFHQFAYTATDSDGDLAQVIIRIWIAGNPKPILAAQDLPDIVMTVGDAPITITLPLATGGDGLPRYRLSYGLGLAPEDPDHALPFHIHYSTRRATFTATSGTQGVYRLRWRVSDADGDSDVIQFYLIINDLPFADSSAGPDYWHYVGDSSATYTLPAVTGVEEDDTDYTLTTASGLALPDHLTFDAEALTLTVEPGPTVPISHELVYTASATKDGDSLQAVLRIFVHIVAPVSFADHDIPPDLTYIVGTGDWPLILPPARGGKNHDQPDTYDLTQADGSPLPAWLQFDDDPERRLLEIATDAAASGDRAELVYTATGPGGGQVDLEFSVTIIEDATPQFPDAAATTASRSFEPAAAPSVAWPLPTATGGNAPLTYHLTLRNGGSLPAEVVFAPWSTDENAPLIQLSTRPPRIVYYLTLTVTDHDGDSDSFHFTVAVAEPPSPPPDPDPPPPPASELRFGCPAPAVAPDRKPAFAGPLPGPIQYTVGQTVNATLPAAANGDGSSTYALTPTVPGLVFDVSSRTLRGVPTTAGTYNLAYTATDEDNDIGRIDIVVTIAATISANRIPFFLSDDDIAISLTAGETLNWMMFPAAAGGDGALAYRVSPATAGGITHDDGGTTGDPTDDTLTGTPAAAGTYTFTLTATDEDGDTATVRVVVTVAAAPPPVVVPIPPTVIVAIPTPVVVIGPRAIRSERIDLSAANEGGAAAAEQAHTVPLPRFDFFACEASDDVHCGSATVSAAAIADDDVRASARSMHVTWIAARKPPVEETDGGRRAVRIGDDLLTIPETDGADANSVFQLNFVVRARVDGTFRDRPYAGDLAEPLILCLARPRTDGLAFIAQYDKPSESWSLLPGAPPDGEGRICARIARIDEDSLFTAVTTDDPSHGLSGTDPGPQTWQGSDPVDPAQLRRTSGDDVLRWWDGERWHGHAVIDGQRVPGSSDRQVPPGAPLWLG